MFDLKPGQQAVVGKAIVIQFYDFRRLVGSTQRAVHKSLLAHQALRNVCHGHFTVEFVRENIEESDLLLTAMSATNNRVLAFLCGAQSCDPYYEVKLLCAGRTICQSLSAADGTDTLLSGLGALLHVIFLTYVQSVPGAKKVFLTAARPELVPYYQRLDYRTGREGRPDEKDRYEEEQQVPMSRDVALSLAAAQRNAILNISRVWPLLHDVDVRCALLSPKRKRSG